MSTESSNLALIWAMDRRRCIGKDGTLPWHLPEDLKHFKKTTLGHVIIMGRKTWESFPKPLPQRTHVVLSTQDGYEAPGAQVFSSLDDGLEWARQHDPSPFVIGGATVYSAALPAATELHVTHIDGVFDGDTYFPEFDENEWEIANEHAGETPQLRFVKYTRRRERS